MENDVTDAAPLPGGVSLGWRDWWLEPVRVTRDGVSQPLVVFGSECGTPEAIARWYREAGLPLKAQKNPAG